MLSKEKGRRLHDRASRGEELTPAERAQLQEWYAVQDQLENNALHLQEQESVLTDLQAEIEEILARLVQTSSRIKEVASENERLRDENAALRNQLADLFGSQSA